jgi:membrane associated rhomboid family serine protease
VRQSEGSVVCPECGRLVAIDEAACPNCGRWRPGLFGFAPTIGRIFGQLEVTPAILWACVLLYAIALVLDPSGALRNSNRGFLGILSPGGRALYQLGMTGGYAQQTGAWFTIFSATFLHGSLLHILFNMMWLRSIGPVLEDVLGPARFFTLFSVAGAVGFLLSNSFTGNPTVGASGAVFGLLAAGVVLGRHHGGSWGEQISQQSMMWAGLLFVWGLISPSTNNWAHGGGFAAGWLVTLFYLKRQHRAESALEQLIALGLVLLTVAAVVISFFRISTELWLR